MPQEAAIPVPIVPANPTSNHTLDEIAAWHIEAALQASHGRIEGPFGAAKALGINPYTLRGRMRKLKINWRQFRG